MEQYDPHVSFCITTLIFDFDHYTVHCLSQVKASIIYSFFCIRVSKHISLQKNLEDCLSTHENMCDNIAEISVYSFIVMAEKKDYQVTVL